MVAIPGSSRSVRAARARVAAALLDGGVADRDDDVQPLGPARLDRAREARPVQRPRTSRATATTVGEFRSLRRVQVEHQGRRMQRVVDAEEGHVVLDRPLVGQPEQGPPVVAEHLVHLSVGRLRPHRHGADPVGGALHHVLLHERGRTGPHALDRQRPPGEQGHDPVGEGVRVVDEIALGHLEAVAQRLVEAGQPDNSSRSSSAISSPPPDLVGRARVDQLCLGEHRARRESWPISSTQAGIA